MNLRSAFQTCYEDRLYNTVNGPKQTTGSLKKLCSFKT